MKESEEKLSIIADNSNDQIFEVEKSYAHTLEYAINEKAKDKISEAGLNLFSINAKIVKQSDNP